MSDVHFQARLNPNSPEESEAIGVLRALEDRGFTRREILATALLVLAERNLDDFEPPENEAVRNAVERAMSGMLERFIDAVSDHFDQLQVMPIDERRREIRDVARSSIGGSVLGAVDVRTYEDE